MKKCTKCEVEKEFTKFYCRKSTKDKLYTICKKCANQDRKEHKKKNEEKTQEYQKKYREENKERMKQQRKEYREQNKVIINQKQKERRKENEEKFNQQRKKYRKENEEKIKQKEREYKQNNKSKRNEQIKQRYKNDPIFKIQRSLRHSTWRTIKYGCKSASTQELLGCTWEEGRIHIENQFLEGMTWENHGEWEIDHIKPIAAFTDLADPEQQRQCCHYTNLRPLWATDNRSKSSIHNGIKYYYKEKGRY